MRRLLALWLLIACVTTAAAATRYAPAQQRALLQSAAMQSHQAELNELVRRGDSAALVAFAGNLVADAESAPLQNEYLLTRWLLALRSAAPDSRLREQVRALTRYGAKALGPGPEPHPAAEMWIPIFDVASQARGTQRAWEFDEHVAQARLNLASGDIGRLPIADAEALAQAIATAPQPQLQTQRVRDPQLPTQAASALARRLQDAELYRALFARPVDSFVLEALVDAARLLPTEEARAVLRAASARRELASAATLAMTALQPSDDELFDCLGDVARGGSCAQLLSRRTDAAEVDRLAEFAGAGGDDLATRRALLALLWTHAPRGREQLQRYADNAAMPPSLRQMVSAWLR